MKPIILLIFLLIFLSISSCEKKDEITISKELPVWVKYKVEDLTANGKDCKFVDVALYEIDGKRYYNIDFGYSSCRLCNVFDEKGNPVSQTEHSNWKEIKLIDIYPGCE
ncbi:MAG: hypothetical protein WC384_19495 [Prolixibacteraceae bacterium]|jgi:uncharacterized ParB-like nuclease family protein